MKYRFFIAFILITGFANSIRAQNANPETTLEFSGSNFRIYPSGVSQTEVFIKRSPIDANTIFSSCNTLSFIPFFVSEGVYISADGGQNWTGSDTCSGDPIAYHGGDPGIVIDKDGRLILTRLGRTPFVGLYSHYSLDNGQTWSGQQVISTDDLERATLGSDAVVESPFYGRTYAVWVKFALPFPLMFACTDDGGQSWTTPVAVNNPDSRSAGGDLAIGPNGELYTCWAGVTEVSPFKEILVGFAKSVDGGDNWIVTENAFPMNGITGVLASKENIRVNGLPSIAVDTSNSPFRGRIYIVTGEKELAPAGSDPDIVLHHSDDSGNTWSDGIRVNQDSKSNGKIQYFPSVHIDRYGAINVLFYDDRHTTSDSTGVFLARSKDGGDTWQEFEVSDHNFKPEPIGGLGQGYQGDNIDITSTHTNLLPVWMDNSTGIYQVWSTVISFSEVNAIKKQGKKQISSYVYPNPFNKTTALCYQTSEKGEVILHVYDAQGNKIFDENLKNHEPGSFIYKLDTKHPGRNLFNRPGIYYYRLMQGTNIETGKMILAN